MDEIVANRADNRDTPVLLAVAVIASLYEWAVFASTFSFPGTIGPNLNAPGGDWIAFYGAARAFLDGHPDLIFDGDRLTAYLNSAFSWWLSQPLAFRPWVYPPSYLLLVLPFAALPFIASYLIFQVATAGLLVAAFGLGPDPRNAKFLVAVCALPLRPMPRRAMPSCSSLPRCSG